MKRSSLLLFLLAVFLPLPCPAQNEIPLATVVRALEAPFRGDSAGKTAIRNFQAEFTQESRLTSLDRSQRGHGRVVVQFDPGAADRLSRAKFRWDYEEPTPQQIVSDGRQFWVYVPENRQVIHSEIEAALQDRPEDPITFLTGLGNLSRDFQIDWASPARDAEGNPVLQLTPRRPSTVLQRLQVVVDRQVASGGKGKGGFPLKAVTVFDPVGNTTEIIFKEVRVNIKLPAKIFNFQPPPGVEVVKPPTRMPR